MKTYTICYSGTDCYLDQGLVLREPKELHSYNPSSGYIPSKIHKRLAQIGPISTTMNGCGGPYVADHQTLPIRIWSIETDIQDIPLYDQDYVQCNEGGQYTIGATDSASGLSVEMIAIAGIAKMLGVTLDLIPAGALEQIREYSTNPGSTGDLDNLVYPENDDSRWNQTKESEAGHYSLRWGQEAQNKIERFLELYDSKGYGRVVLLGHSRGGVACLIAANYLAEWFPSLELKIVALDPVPGPGSWWNVLTHIPQTSNMEYVGVYAIDETSGGFNGVVPRVKKSGESSWDPLNQNSVPIKESDWSDDAYTLIYTRGRHATVPGSRSVFGNGEGEPIDDYVGSSGNLVNAYVVRKMNDWGVPLEPESMDTIKQWVNDMNSISEHFAKMRNHNYSVDTPFVTLFPNKLGMLNGRLYFNARGISSSNGNDPRDWNYLEAYIPYAKPDDFPKLDHDQQLKMVERVNQQRGLIDAKLKAKYHSILKTGHVHPWTYLGEVDFN